MEFFKGGGKYKGIYFIILKDLNKIFHKPHYLFKTYVKGSLQKMLQISNGHLKFKKECVNTHTYTLKKLFTNSF